MIRFIYIKHDGTQGYSFSQLTKDYPNLMFSYSNCNRITKKYWYSSTEFYRIMVKD